MPPLSARPADVPALTEFFVAKHGGPLGNRVLGVANDVIEMFKAYTFPGNVRELQNEIRRMVAVANDSEYLTRRHLSPELAKLRAVEPPAAKLGLKAGASRLRRCRIAGAAALAACA